MLSSQLSLFGREQPSFDAAFHKLERDELGRGAWLDYAPGWVDGHASLFDTLLATMQWRAAEDEMYDRIVQVPRLFAVVPRDGSGPALLEEMRLALSQRYGETFTRVSFALYRHGQDSVAWHGDRVARKMPNALVATVSVGAPRRFLLRRYGGGARVRALHLGWGDLLVMGGSCQRTFQHAVPKVARAAPRIAIMFRPDWPEL